MADPLDIYHPSSKYPFDQDSGDVFSQLATEWASSSFTPSLCSPSQESWNQLATSSESDGGPIYDMSLPFSDADFPEIAISEFGDISHRASPPPSSDHSNNSPSPSSSSVCPSSSTPHLEFRRLTKDDIQADPRLRDTIQTVSEYRKSRRRAQNRAAQQAFKARKQMHEKELNAKIKAIEESYAKLQGQNTVLVEDLRRMKEEWQSFNLLERGGSDDASDGVSKSDLGAASKTGHVAEVAPVRHSPPRTVKRESSSKTRTRKLLKEMA